jgi:hypothetical protein
MNASHTTPVIGRTPAQSTPISRSIPYFRRTYRPGAREFPAASFLITPHLNMRVKAGGNPTVPIDWRAAARFRCELSAGMLVG